MFYEKYLKTTKEKHSYFNINLDPALPRQRNVGVIPDNFLMAEEKNAILNFSYHIIEQVSEYCCSIKPNTQYFLGSSIMLKRIVKKIHDEGMLAILDHKLSDIGSSNDSAIFWISEMGFDAFTFSPFAGNIQNTVRNAHKKNLGIFVLTLMSNPEAEKLMVKTRIDDAPYYLHIAKTVKESHADGCVVGLTNFVKSEYIKNLQKNVGNRVVFLMQGIGPQGGDASKIRYATNPLISLGRTVIYSDNPKKTVKKYYDLFKTLKDTP